MCNCINETEERIKNLMSENNEDYKNKTITNVSLQSKVYLCDVEQSYQLTNTAEVEYSMINKKNVVVHKKHKIFITYRFCPLCGEKYK